MAGQAEKKRTQNASTTYDLYCKIILGLYAAYIPLRVFYCWSSFGFWTFLGLLLLSAINYVAVAAVKQALELGSPVTGAQDVLFVNWAVMALSIFTDKAFYLFLVIPGYLVYQYGHIIRGYLFPPTQPVEAPTEADAKRQAKKERQAAMNERRRG